MLNRFIEEFIDIGTYIKEKMPENVHSTYFFIEQARLRKMLNKKLYAEAKAKLRVWRNLGWLKCDTRDRFTKVIKINNKPKRVAVINRVAFEQILALLPEDWNAVVSSDEAERLVSMAVNTSQ